MCHAADEPLVFSTELRGGGRLIAKNVLKQEITAYVIVVEAIGAAGTVRTTFHGIYSGDSKGIRPGGQLEFPLEGLPSPPYRIRVFADLVKAQDGWMWGSLREEMSKDIVNNLRRLQSSWLLVSERN